MSVKCKYSRTFFEKWLRMNMAWIGRSIGEAPVWCMLTSTFVFAVFAIGLFSLHLPPNLDNMRHIEGGPSAKVNRLFDDYFPVNFTHFTPDRAVDPRQVYRAILLDMSFHH
jgi:hypothetical protein